MARNPKPASAAPTTAQSLGALLKSARDIMRKDNGLNGGLDRLPLLTWIMFLKFLDDLELQRQGELQFTLPDVLKVPPISQHGNVNEIIGKFGGTDQLRNAV